MAIKTSWLQNRSRKAKKDCYSSEKTNSSEKLLTISSRASHLRRSNVSNPVTGTTKLYAISHAIPPKS